DTVAETRFEQIRHSRPPPSKAVGTDRAQAGILRLAAAPQQPRPPTHALRQPPARIPATLQERKLSCDKKNANSSALRSSTRHLLAAPSAAAEQASRWDARSTRRMQARRR